MRRLARCDTITPAIASDVAQQKAVLRFPPLALLISDMGADLRPLNGSHRGAGAPPWQQADGRRSSPDVVVERALCAGTASISVAWEASHTGPGMGREGKGPSCADLR